MFDGWFRSEGMMGAVSKMLRLGDILSDMHSESVAEIAVFAEGPSMYRARKSCGLGTTCLSDIRRTLAEAGAPYDVYSISDLALPEITKYKLLVFINQYDMPAERKAQIDHIMSESGAMALWLYAPGYATNGDNGVEHCKELTDINIIESVASHGDMIYEGKKYSFPAYAPYLSVEDGEAIPLSRFEDGSIAAAYKGAHAYAATPNIPSALLREIAKLAGVFIFSDCGRVYTYKNSAMLGVYNSTDADATLRVKEDGKYTDLLTEQTFIAEGGMLKLPVRELRAFMLVK